MKNSLFLLVFCLCTIQGFAQNYISSFEKTGFEAQFSVSENHNLVLDNFAPNLVSFDSTTFKKRKPGVAFLWSFLISGGGQFYNGEYYKGGVMLGSTLFALALVLDGEDNPSKGYQPGLDIGVPIIVGVGLWSLIDAPISANKLNKQNGVTFNIKPSLQRRSNFLTNKSELTFGPKLTLSF